MLWYCFLDAAAVVVDRTWPTAKASRARRSAKQRERARSNAPVRQWAMGTRAQVVGARISARSSVGDLAAVRNVDKGGSGGEVGTRRFG